jgi:hypothetical protein
MKYPCDRFAAFLAHCLNSEDSPLVQVSPGSLYAQLTEALGARYAEPMLHYPGYAWRMSREEVAMRYFDISLARPLLLSPRVQLSVAHRLFAALCLRGSEPAWREAALQRELDSVADQDTVDVVPVGVRRVFDECRRQLGKLADRLSPGSASPTIRARYGAIVLRLYTLHAAVPEEISIWNAVSCAPSVLRPLAAGEPFNRFCGLIIDCVRTAHRPFQELLGLGRGLCPFDWITTLSIQQTRALRKFLKVLEESQQTDTPAHWDSAWQRAPVPGFTTAAHLWQSEIGQALRQVLGRGFSADSRLVERLAADSDDSTDEIPEFLPEEEFSQQLELLEADGAINSTERWLLEQLYHGVATADLIVRPEIKAELRRRRATFASLVEQLRQRVEEWAQRFPPETPA